MKEALSYDDVLLVPQYSDIKSRSECDLSSKLGEFEFETPLIASPMNTVTEEEMAAALGQEGGLGIIHRYCSIENQVSMVHETINQRRNRGIASAAIGITGDYLERAQALVEASRDQNDAGFILCLDVAHGHCETMKTALYEVRKVVGEDVHLMAATIATGKAYQDLSEWGADSVRVGVGGGSICQTRIVTGHGVPTFQSLIDCVEWRKNSKKDCTSCRGRGFILSGSKSYSCPYCEEVGSIKWAQIIADGGHRNSGDCVKALAAGADFVIAGSLFAGTDQSPGEYSYSSDGQRFKAYSGMAANKWTEDGIKEVVAPEGIATMVKAKGDVRDVLKHLNAGIQSGMSYSGARTLGELRKNAQFIRQTHAGAIESNPHILRRK